MQGKERVKRIIGRKKVDCIPYSFDLTSYIQKKVAQYYGVESTKLSEFIDDNLKYVVCKDPSASFEVNNANMKEYVDEFGVVWDISEETNAIGDWEEIKSQPLKQASLKEH